MTRPLIPLFASLVPAFLALAPAPAAAESGAQAVNRCRAEMLGRFGPDEVRSYRIASIDQSARRTRVAFYVTTDQRRRFECTAGADGQVLTAAFDPPPGGRNERLAAGEAAPHGGAQPH